MTSELGILFIMLFLLLSGALSLAFQWWGAHEGGESAQGPDQEGRHSPDSGTIRGGG